MSGYTLDTVKKLEFFEAVRKYPGMYIGSKDIDGLHHLPKEIESNSIDEYLNGACTKIVTTLKDDWIQIEDDGRGIPIGNKDGGKTALELCFTEEHAGGKFLNATGESGYNSAGGMHGLGAKCVNALSDWMEVISFNKGQKEFIRFEDGIKVTHKTEECIENKHGVSVKFKPSLKYLEVVEFDPSRIREMLQEFSFLCKGLTFVFIDNDKEEVFLSNKGLYDYLDYLNDKPDYVCKPMYFEESEGTFKVEVAFGYNDSYGSKIKLFTNNIPQLKGTHLTGFKTAFTSSFNNFAKEKGWLKEKDNNLQGSDLEEGLNLVINFKMIDPVFKGQNKEELSSTEGRTYVQRFSSLALPQIFSANEKEIKNIFNKAIFARKAREAAKKARDAVREPKDKKKTKLLNLPSKLVDANSKDRSACELFIVEGDSAAGGMIAARNPETQAIFPIRGKLINIYKNSPEKVFANQEVINLIKAIGLDFDTKTNKMVYNKNKLRYARILPACDGDPDGQAIKNLLLTFFWSLCPELILNGHIWVTIPPLFRITKGKDTYVYLKDAAALEEYKATHVGEKYLVNRNKGLGEQDSEELGPCLLDPETRNAMQVIVESEKKANELFEILMGTSVPPRREWLLQHSEEASDNLW